LGACRATQRHLLAGPCGRPTEHHKMPPMTLPKIRITNHTCLLNARISSSSVRLKSSRQYPQKMRAGTRTTIGSQIVVVPSTLSSSRPGSRPARPVSCTTARGAPGHGRTRRPRASVVEEVAQRPSRNLRKFACTFFPGGVRGRAFCRWSPLDSDPVLGHDDFGCGGGSGCCAGSAPRCGCG
jgi:hypothetical protein